ncbi:Rieske (2Fe-2S) protein [Simiduia sp. 21SJ11W-1]|uniref:Rieske (2Fe-2S) protein n=1 Tax=Simiduia sp. 21SJ11W-1 TaxID=2909669 RepID=UPI00209CBDC7|nr:Rieske (2Fe-2S) protein [Simiduia sp. 21SJ11W-1]UTA49600.1 Rieske (2Fe-2S) protein [Simiduia sp. 21SJ11W-1]
MAYHPLEQLINLHDGYCRPFQVAGHALLLVQDEGRPYVLVNRCPHMDARMDRAQVMDNHIRCPVHGIAFNLVTGVAQGPLAHCLKQLEKLPHAFEGTTIGVDL